MESQVPSPRSSNYSIKADYKLSFSLYHQNFLPIFEVLLLGIIIKEILDFIFVNLLSPFFFLPYPTTWNNIIYFLIHLPGDSIYFGFFGACVGMCHDIMSSGDQFTQLRRFVYYLRKYWLIYFALSFFINLPMNALYFFKDEWISLGLFIVMWFITVWWFFMIVETNPAVLVRRRFGQALKDNFYIFRSHALRITLTFGIIVLVFLVPRTTFRILELFYSWLFTKDQLSLIKWIQIIMRWLYVLIGNPLIAFLSIGIYNEYIGFNLSKMENIYSDGHVK
jgi:hypothetical protein